MPFNFCLLSGTTVTFGTVTKNGQNASPGALAAGDVIAVGSGLSQAVIRGNYIPDNEDPIEVEHTFFTLLPGSEIQIPTNFSQLTCETEHRSGRIVIQDYYLPQQPKTSKFRVKKRTVVLGGIGTCYSNSIETIQNAECARVSVIDGIVKEYGTTLSLDAGYTMAFGTEPNTPIIPEAEKTPSAIENLISPFCGAWSQLECS